MICTRIVTNGFSFVRPPAISPVRQAVYVSVGRRHLRETSEVSVSAFSGNKYIIGMSKWLHNPLACVSRIFRLWFRSLFCATHRRFQKERSRNADVRYSILVADATSIRLTVIWQFNLCARFIRKHILHIHKYVQSMWKAFQFTRYCGQISSNFNRAGTFNVSATVRLG